MVDLPPSYNGNYFDGISARPIAVTIECGMVIEIFTADGALFKRWNWDDLREEDAPPGYCRLSNDKEHPLARLEITNSQLIETIRAAAPALKRKRALDKSARNKMVSLVFLAVVSLAGVIFYGIPAIATRITPLVPLEWEARLGRLLEPRVAEAFKIKPLKANTCSTPQGDAAVNKLLVRMTGSAKLPFTPRIKVIRNKMVNAFALPGGTVFLMQGLVGAANSPDAVAGVLAHEFGHVQSRDSIRKIAEGSSRSFILSLLLGDVTGSTVVIFASEAVLGAAYSRDIERNADNFAIDRLNEAKVSAKPMAELFASLNKTSGKSKVNLFSSHPLTSERIKRLTESVSTFKNKPVLDAREWQALRTICD